MLKNYLKISFRQIRKNKFFSFLNIFGLAIGISACILIIAYVQDEFSYDTFHPNIENKYVMALDAKIGDNETFQTSTPPPLAPTLETDIPQVTSATRVHHTGDLLFRAGKNAFTEDDAYWADANFFRFFGYNLLKGDPKNVLKAPNQVVITESMAQKYFGDEDPIGKNLLVGNEEEVYEVSGVSADPPENSHLQYDILISFNSTDLSQSQNWFGNQMYTYAELKKDASMDALNNNIRDMVVTNIGPLVERAFGKPLKQFESQGGRLGYQAVPILDLRLNAEELSQGFAPPSSITYVYVLSIISILLILIACFNFMNLSTAKATNRVREVGIRKTLGSHRKSMIGQFLMESGIYVALAIILSLGLVYYALPWFNQIAGKNLNLSLYLQPWFLLSLAGFLVGLSLLAGSYPAFYLSGFRPVQALKGKLSNKGNKSGLRKTLVVSQFFFSIGLIACTFLVNDQLQLMQNKNLGIHKERTVVINNTSRLGNSQATFREELTNLTEIDAASYASHTIPGYHYSTFMKKKGADADQVVPIYWADWYQDDVLGIKMRDGRYFQRDYQTDSTAVVINETAANNFGFEDPVGKQIVRNGDFYTVIGVMKDFNFDDVQYEIDGLVIFFQETANEMLVSFQSESPQKAVSQIKSTWNKYAGGVPLEYSFLDDDFNQLFEQEQKLSKLFSAFTILAIIIACMGLFGLSAFMAERRTKEIGVRKVLGASVGSIVQLLSKEYLKLVGIAFIIATPISWYFISQWLQDFAYRIELSPLTFILTGIVTLVVVLLTISWQTITAALSNPVDSIQKE